MATGALPQRQARSRMRLAAETTRAVLLLDHVEDVTLAMRGYLRSLRGGLACFVDIDAQREHAALRSWHLGHAEFWMPPLSARWLRRMSTSAVFIMTHESVLERTVP